ncbi:hypothetical protein QTG54_003509 [Skeletonema marinoi]|uniref:Uncharacterized protein n=1 Tax=Skeletonema marinoi TaxID=267567 RepID=A0AAD8YHJ9_9STRA|nr:hypothetical protein QTG54_003509 [Skeletonema marinoi]
MMEYTEEVEAVLPAGYSIGNKKKEASSRRRDAPGNGSSSRTTEKKTVSSRKGLFSRSVSKKLSKLRASRDKKSKAKVTSPTPVTKSTTQKKNPSAPSSQKQTKAASKIVKDDRRDTEEVPTSSQPTREGSPAPTTECSLTDESAESQPKPLADHDDDESTIMDTTSIYGRITGVQKQKVDVEEKKEEKAATPIEPDTTSMYGMITGMLSPTKSNVEEVKEKEAATPMESLLTATTAFVRGQSGINVSSKKIAEAEPTKQHTDDEVAFEHDEIVEQASVEVVQEEVSQVAKPVTWAKNFSLKVGGFETSFQIADPVATITDKVNEVTDKVNEVIGGLDSDLVKQAEALEHKEIELDYEENPTKLFLLLQQKAWGLAMMQLEKHPEEAEVWVYRKFVPESAPNVPDASDPGKSQALVKQETALSTVVKEPAKYRWRLLPLHASIVLGAPQEVTTKILLTYPEAARKVDERGSLPVHLAASRLDVDDEGEKVVLQLFGAYTDSIDITDRNGRTAPELAKLARARKAAEKQRLMETASRSSRLSRACIETSASMNGREEEDDDDDDDSSYQIPQFDEGSKSMDMSDKKSSKGGDLETAKSDGDDDDIVADVEGMAPGFSFLTAANVTDEREAQTIADEVSKVQSDEENKSIAEEYKTSSEGLNEVPACALELPLPASTSFGDESVRSTKSTASVRSTRSSGSAKSKSSKLSQPPKSEDDTVVSMTDEASVVSTAVETIAATPDPQAALRAVLEKACENAGRPGMDVTKFLVVLEEEWVTDVEAIRRLDGATLDSILPIMLSRELQRLVNHSNTVDGEYLRRNRGRRKNKPSKSAKKKKKKRSARRHPASRLTLDPINEEDLRITSITEEEDESAYSAAATEGEDNTADDKTADEPVATYDNASSMEGTVDENEMHRNQAALVIEARHRFPTREALEDAIHERQATVNLAVGSGFDVDKGTLTRAALADDEVRKLLPLRLVLPTAADLREMLVVLQNHKEDALKEYDVTKALKIQTEMDEIEKQIDEEEVYLRRKNVSQTSCVKCGTNFETKKKMVGILKKKEMMCDNCRVMPMPEV